MRARTLFFGALRSVPAVAMLTLRQQLRDRALLTSALIFFVFVSVYAPDERLDDPAAAVRAYLRYVGAGASVLILAAGAFAAVGLKAESERVLPAARSLSRLIGPAAWFWGRGLGIALFVLLLSICAGGLSLLHYMRVFGDTSGDYQVTRLHRAVEFEGQRGAAFLRKEGDRRVFHFELGDGVDRLEHLVVRFHPRLLMTEKQAPLRSRIPVRIIFRDPDGRWRRQHIARINEGKPTVFDVGLPRKERPRRIQVIVERSSPYYAVRIGAEDLLLRGESESFFAALLRSALVLGLLSASIAAFATLAAQRFSYGSAVLIGGGLLVAGASVTVLDDLLYERAPELFREVLVGGLRVLLPDLSAYDVTARLARSETVGWDLCGAAALRLVLTVFCLGVADHFLPRRRQEAS